MIVKFNDYNECNEIDSKSVLRYNLSFFKDDTPGEKTEKPTAKRKKKARDDGSVAKSQEISTAVMFILVFALIKMVGPALVVDIKEVYYLSLELMTDMNSDFNSQYLYNLAIFLFQRLVIMLAPIFIVILIIGVSVNLVQVGWNPTTKPLKPKLSNLNPVKGVKKLFGVKNLIELVKSLAKMALISYALYNALSEELHMIAGLYSMGLIEGFAYIAELATDIGIYIGQLYIVVAIIDYSYVKYKHDKDLKMSKQDIKDEHKQSEGDPKVKAAIKRKMLQVSMRRMMQDVPKADVIITNPTHYAVAIKYNRFNKGAPIVVAKGVDYMAQKIKDKAKESSVEIVENRQVARSLYSLVEVGQEVPPELYQAVAEILAFVYKLKKAI